MWKHVSLFSLVTQTDWQVLQEADKRSIANAWLADSTRAAFKSASQYTVPADLGKTKQMESNKLATFKMNRLKQPEEREKERERWREMERDGGKELKSAIWCSAGSRPPP